MAVLQTPMCGPMPRIGVMQTPMCGLMLILTCLELVLGRLVWHNANTYMIRTGVIHPLTTPDARLALGGV